jgi:hypothetical protein
MGGRAVADGMDETGRGRPVAILLPTLNEERGLERTLKELPLARLRETGYDPRVLVLDGHSTDRTVEVAREFGAEVLHQAGTGKGAALREGLAWAAAQGVDHVAVLDADFTYPAAGVPPIFSLLDAGSDLVIGVRRPSHAPLSSARNLIHRLGNGLLNSLAAQLSHSPVLDICSGLWGVRVSSIQGLTLLADGFEIEAELFLKAFRSGLLVSQIPIEYRERVGMAKLRTVRDGSRITLAILRYARTSSGVGPAASNGGVRAAASPPADRGLERLILSTGVREITVYSHPGRAADAGRLAESFRRAQVGVRVVVRPYHTLANDGWFVPGMAPSKGDVGPSSSPILIKLLERTNGDGPVAVVGIPQTQRLVWLGTPPTPSPSLLAQATRSGGYRLERSFHRRPSSLSLLNAALAPSPRIRELALLGANGSSTPVHIYEYVPPANRPPERPAPDLGTIGSSIAETQ